MLKKILATIALTGPLVFLSTRSSAAEPPADAVDIRDDGGNIVVAADQIVSYDWSTHTITLPPNARKKLAAGLTKTGRVISGTGIPFAVSVGGKPIYSGKFTSSVSSISLSTPVILLDPATLDPMLSDDQLRIQLGYPTQKFFKGEDPRGNPQIRSALRATGKLAKAPPEFTQWIADSLREIQTLKPGMTRADLLRVFEEEGGVSTRLERRYAFRDCPYIKVNVKFDPAASPNDRSERHDYIISQISQPFLEWSIAD